MRLTMAVWWSLALVWLLTSQAGAEPAADHAARHVEIKGYGLSIEAAKKDALTKAIAELTAELRQQQLEHWQPTEAEVQRHLLKTPGRAANDEVVAAGIPPSKTWMIELTIPAPEALQQLDRRALRREVSETRMSLTLRVVAALAFFLAVAVGCIRADEWTGARYTNWLRLAGAGVVAAAAAGWWWLR